MSIRHQIIREHPIQHFAMDSWDPFRYPGWRGEGMNRGDPFRDWPAAARDWPAPREHPHWPAPREHTHLRDSSFRDVVPRDYYSSNRETAGALVPAMLPPPSTALPLSRTFFNPERELGVMDHEMSRMTSEMRRMFSDMQHLMPVDADPESWRSKENFLLENPIVHDKEGNRNFRLKFDVRQFRPEEIFVKTMGNELIVHAKHEEKGQDKSMHREYKRLYVLPKELSPENLVSKLTRDGVLSIEAQLPPKEGHRDRLIPIKHE